MKPRLRFSAFPMATSKDFILRDLFSGWPLQEHMVTVSINMLWYGMKIILGMLNIF